MIEQATSNFKVAQYPHGHFSWADCTSGDQEAAKDFYAKLMGWGTEDMPLGEDWGVYTMFTSQGVYTAGLGQLPAEMAAQGIPSYWTNYVSVDNVDALLDTVTEQGGMIIAPAMDIFDSGRMAVIQDPTGAQLGLWQPKNHKGAGIVNTPGAMTWNELYTRDLEKARAFYNILLGWEYEAMEGMDYYTIQTNGRANGGIMQLSADWGDAPSHWAVYFSVADIDAAVATVTELGGTVMGAVRDAGGVGRFTFAQDPMGAAFALIQLEQPQPWDL